MDFKFPKTLRLRNRYHYKQISNGNKRKFGHYIILEVRKSPSSKSKMGITVSRKYGEAHKRNRFKRIVREAFRLSQHKIPQHLEMNIKPRFGAEHAKTNDIIQDLMHLLTCAPSIFDSH